MARVNAKRRGHSIRPIAFHTPGWSKDLVHLVAHLSFDGRVDRYGCSYYSRTYGQVVHVKRLLQQLLGVTPRTALRSNGIWVLSYYNVEVASWLSQKERQLLVAIRSRPQWQRQWLQAFFDDEGHIHVGNGVRRVRASQDDLRILLAAKRFLKTLEITSRIDQQAQAIEITGRENLTHFMDGISFAPGIRINAHRKNGLWAQNLEKRTLLTRALNSYRH